MVDYVALAVIGAVLVAIGFGMWSPAFGMVVAGLELIVAAYAGAYVKTAARVAEKAKR